VARGRLGPPLITVDSSGVLALLNRGDVNHERVTAAFDEDGGPYVVPVGLLGEVGYLLESRLGGGALQIFLADLGGVFTLDCGEEDLQRVRDLVARYDDLPLGYADAAVVACAERHGGRVLTLDLRHFGVVAGERTIEVFPS
jgi:predicted nucleic acid-binding protein